MQVPTAQAFAAQSAFTPQPAPGPQFGEQAGDPHTPPTHAPVTQSPSATQLIDMNAAVQTPRLQFSVLQSPNAPDMPHADPFGQLGAQAGGVQTPFVQSRDWQSALTLHAVPSRLPRFPVHFDGYQLLEFGGAGISPMSWLAKK